MSELHILNVTNPDNGKKLRLFFGTRATYDDTVVGLLRIGYRLDGIRDCAIQRTSAEALSLVSMLLPRV